MSTPVVAAAACRRHLAEEVDAAYLYTRLALLESDARRRRIFERLAEVEERHVALWLDRLRKLDEPALRPRPSVRARVTARLAQRFGKAFLLKTMLRAEGYEVKTYLALHRASTPGPDASAALRLAQESAQHARVLQELAGSTEESWHQIASGGFLRNVVYGFNDGLTANFGLVAGVFGADAHLGFIILSGLSGAVADALSMGSSGYLAAKSEREVYAHEIAMERDEILVMPELETEELALIYEAKGMPPEQAAALATEIMRTPDKALEEMVREELKIGADYSSPLREAFVTGTATILGALIPVAPFLMLPAPTAAVVSFTISMLAHFGVGAARSLFTGRGIFRSGIDMFVVGLGVALAGYFAGDVIMRLLPQ